MEDDILKIVKDLGKGLPKFPDGRINYTGAQTAAALNVFVVADSKILLLKRSDKVGNYGGKWATIAGYLDEVKPVEEKVFEELREEIGVLKENVLSIVFGKVFRKIDSKLNKTWIILPLIAKLKSRPEIKLDWEHTEFKWVSGEEILNFDLMPGVESAMDNLPDF